MATLPQGQPGPALLAVASLSRSAKWGSQPSCLGFLGQESTFIYSRQACDAPGAVPGLQGPLSNGGISARGKRSVAGQAPLCPVLCHRIPSLAHSRTRQGWGRALDQERGHAPGPPPLGSEMRGWDLEASGVPSSSQIWTSQGLPGLTLPGLPAAVALSPRDSLLPAPSLHPTRAPHSPLPAPFWLLALGTCRGSSREDL